MKKIMIFAAFAAALSLASCQKEALNEAAGTESPVFTATISTGTKTTVNATNGEVAWELSDKITITDASAAFAIYKIKSIDGNTGKATFEVESGTLGQGPYTATYGTAPTTAQTYNATPGNLYMTASSETTTLTFTVQCGLMEINLTKAGESVKSIAVIGTPTGKSEATYTLTCTEAQSIAEKKSFYIALPAGSYNKIVITDSNDKVCTLTAASGLALENNHIKPVTFDANKLNFLPDGALPGKFSVSADKKVYFSKGNLYYDGSNWGFEAEQYYFRTYNGNGKYDANGYSTSSGTASGHWGLFGWVGASSTAFTSSPEIYGVSISGTDSDYGNSDSDALKADWGTAIDDKGTWRTLTHEEWCYLFDNHVKVWGQCNSVNGYFIAPDGYEGDATALTSAVTDWASAEAAGIVFLPAAGYRYDSRVYDVGDCGKYWSSTASGSSTAYSVTLFILSFLGDLDGENRRSDGISVRLITESK